MSGWSLKVHKTHGDNNLPMHTVHFPVPTYSGFRGHVDYPRVRSFDSGAFLLLPSLSVPAHHQEPEARAVRARDELWRVRRRDEEKIATTASNRVCL